MYLSLIRIIAKTSTALINCPSITSATGNGTCNTGLPVVSAGSNEVHTALTIFFGIAGVISVLMIIVGGFMFVTSGGNPQNATKARETIIYAVVGLVVSLFAEILVAFILGKL